MIAEADISKAYNALSVRREELYHYTEKEIQAKERLKDAEMILLSSSGTIIGKNSEAREAQVRGATKLERIAIIEVEIEKRRAQADFDIALLRVREYRDLLTLRGLELQERGVG